MKNKSINNINVFNINILKISGIFVVAVMIIFSVLFFVNVSTRSAVSAVAKNYEMPSVILDAGHGGFDGGAVAADGTVEKDLNLAITQKLYNILKFNGYEIILTRNGDFGTEDNSKDSISRRKKSDLKNRLELMNEFPNSIYVSIHLNKFTTTAACGAQVFYTPNFDEAQLLGNLIQSSVVSTLQPNNMRLAKKGTSSTYLLKNATVPAVIVECGFLSNKNELQLLKDGHYQSKLAFCISNGINDYFQQNKGD